MDLKYFYNKNENIFLDDHIQLIDLSSGSDPSVGQIVKAIGWGVASDRGASINYVDRILRIFDPLSALLTTLLNKLMYYR